MRVLGGLSASGDHITQSLFGWKSQRPAGSLDWVFPAFELLSQALRDMSSINLELVWN